MPEGKIVMAFDRLGYYLVIVKEIEIIVFVRNTEHFVYISVIKVFDFVCDRGNFEII